MAGYLFEVDIAFAQSVTLLPNPYPYVYEWAGDFEAMTFAFIKRVHVVQVVGDYENRR